MNLEPSHIQRYKIDLREKMSAIRDQWPAEHRAQASQTVTEKCLALAIPPEAVISAYWPMNSELDCRELCGRLFQRGHSIGLPVTLQKGHPLLFRSWRPRQPLKPSPLNILVPDDAAPVLIPDWLFVPLLAFDRNLYRLGYGGGFYDRTLTQLRREKTIKAIGIAFSIQEIDKVPVEACDAQLDMILTEKEEIKLR